METATAKLLVDKIYEKRKAAALELEKQIRDAHGQGDERRITQIIDQLVDMFSNPSNPLHVRNGGLIGLAGAAIALGVDVAPYMDKFVYPLLDCFVDPENRIRYFSAECLYNIAKVSKGEILVFFNDIFDALSKLAADSELSVKNGAELLDRLLKDVVAESASVYVPMYSETEKIRDETQGVLVPYQEDGSDEGPRKAFSLAHFIPLLKARIYVVSPFTRSYLVAWITVLDSVPELELITYLPEFLDGLLKYLSDPNEDVRVATETLLADFLREIREVSSYRRRAEEKAQSLRNERGGINGIPEGDDGAEDRQFQDHDSMQTKEGQGSDVDFADTGVWHPGQGVKIDFPAIIEILIEQLDGEHDEIQQSAALRWLADFLTFASDVMVPFTPRLIPAILPNLAHHASMIQNAAVRTNKLLLSVIQALPAPTDSPARSMLSGTNANSSTNRMGSPTVPPSSHTSRSSTALTASSKESSTRGEASSPELGIDSPSASPATLPRSRNSNPEITNANVTPRAGQAELPLSRPHSPVSFTSQHQLHSQFPQQEELDPFDYQATVNELTIQFLSEYEETRVTALKWLIMLHQKAPKKILVIDDGTFPALLKTLSDPSEEVIKQDLQLLAQISSSSEEIYFKSFMVNLLELFSTDRRLLEARGSLIIRQLCLNLNTERIYRTFAEILEKEEDLEFASVIVQKLNLILTTSPELADFRRRLKSLETRQDGQVLFTTLYRSWCHNAVAVFSLCLLAQAYEHASNLLYIFADLEVTVQMLTQIDKLVQLIESPVFTYLRLQLLEPERYPHLFKCLYGLLMLLPQSSAFVSLRNRLNAVNSAGFLHIAPKPSGNLSSARSKLGREEIKWSDLLLHFRSVQSRHEKARRQAMGVSDSASDIPLTSMGGAMGGGDSPSVRPPIRRKVTNEVPPSNGFNSGSSSGSGSAGGALSAISSTLVSRAGALSPLNPTRSRVSGGTANPAVTNSLVQQIQKQKRNVSVGKKP